MIRRSAALLLAALWVGCGVPEGDEGPPPPLPAEVEAFLAPDTSRAAPVSEGVLYRYLWSSRGPWAVHLVEVDLSRCDLGFRVARAPTGRAEGGGRARVSALAREAGEGTVAAVNGDFFTPEGLPLGTEVTEEGLRSPRSRPAFAWSPGAGPWIGTTRIAGDTLLEAGPVTLALEEGSRGAERALPVVLSGFPELLDRGMSVDDLGVSSRPAFAAARHPRTAVGFSEDRSTLWLVVVDGRQAPRSVGMSLPELARLFRTLGADEALNLDGGGSSVLVVEGEAVSRPSDPTGERPVVNALVLVEDGTYCEAGSVPAGVRRRG